jgi:Calcineurin-like phosphoesterase
MKTLRRALSRALPLFVALLGLARLVGAEELQLVYTSDAHFGITRPRFRGDDDVDALTVNKALVERINGVSAAVLPADGGLGEGKAVGPVDYLVETGDIANREEGKGDKAIQSATASWRQFTETYVDGLRLKGHDGRKAELLLVPGNHDVSNAIGSYKAMTPPKDPAALLGIYNMMMKPAAPKTAATLDASKDRVNYSRDVAGLHFVFVQTWPDLAARAWLESDLAMLSASTPVLLFTHANPELESKYFTNPNGAHDMNAKDKFENVVDVTFASGAKVDDPSVAEQRDLAAFLKKHPNVVAYFHGHVHLNQFYTWVGPDKDLALPVVSVDSPMKGIISSADERKLSFQLITIDTDAKLMTIREVLWNADPENPAAPLAFGGSETLSLLPRK